MYGNRLMQLSRHLAESTAAWMIFPGTASLSDTRSLPAGSYTPARLKLLTPAVITLQRFMRGHLARRRYRQTLPHQLC